MNNIRIGITGQSGFIGNHLSNNIRFLNSKYFLLNFEDSWFENTEMLDSFVEESDVIVHLAGINRHDSEKFIYERNIELSNILINSLKRSKSKTHLLFSSSIQEGQDNPYGKSKKISRENFSKWAFSSKNIFTGLLIPNLYGPFGKPNYNSVIATFCSKLINNQSLEIINDKKIKLLYIQDLCEKILDIIDKKIDNHEMKLSFSKEMKVSEILDKLSYFKSTYMEMGIIPELNSDFQLNLFNTFRSYIDHSKFFPVSYKVNSDKRGSFVELLKSNIQGQFSFSTTNPDIVRGNHFHTRKIERFSVISGKALIEIRKIDSEEKISFEVDGSDPSYIDMPIWYTHNIKNIGNTELITNFWINEFFDPNDMDTYFYEV